MRENYENFDNNYCSRLEAGNKCICRVGDGYPKVPKFDLVCTRSSRDGCLGSQNLEVIPSTNSVGETTPPTPPPPFPPIPIPIGEEEPTAEQKRELGASAAKRRLNPYGLSTAAGACEETKTSAAVVMKSLDVLGEADFSNERKMYETWKIPPSLLPCKESITSILAAIPNGTQGTGEIVQKDWKPYGGNEEDMKNNLVSSVAKQLTGDEDDVGACNALLVILGENLDFEAETSGNAAGGKIPNVVDKTLELEIFGRGKQKCQVRLYNEKYSRERSVLGTDAMRGQFTVNVPSSNYTQMETITFEMNYCVTNGGNLDVRVTEQAPKSVIRGPGREPEPVVPYVKWEAEYNVFGKTRPGVIFVPGVDIVNPTNDYDSLILSMENVPSYGMPSWINKNEELLKKNGFTDPLLSWMKVVIFNLSFEYLPTSQFQSLFTDPLEYGEVMNIYMGNYTPESPESSADIDIDIESSADIDIGPQLPPHYFEALQKQRDAQEKIDQKYLKKDDTGDWVIPWDILEKIKDTDCGGDECYADQNYVSGGLAGENCALCTYVTPLLALAALQRRKSTMSDGELRRRLQEVDYADSYMYVTKIHTLETRAVGFGGALETVFYGESDAALQSLLSSVGWGGLPPDVADSAHRLAGSIKTPGAMVAARGVSSGESTESWLNTIVKFGMYLSHPTSFEEMKDPQNRISKYAILNNSIPKDRTDNSYEMREPLAGFYVFESVARQLPDFVSRMIADYLPGPVGVMNMCPPSFGSRQDHRELIMWLNYYAQSNFELVIKKLEGVPFPNGACWAPLPIRNVDQLRMGLRLSALNDHIRFPRGGVNQVGMTNIRDYTQGGRSGVNDDDSEANPPLIWDKCCAQSCYKPCSDAEKEDGCVTGTRPATFFPRFTFTDVEVATSLGLKRAYFSEHILKLIKNMKANNEVYLANITCDPYFLYYLRTTNIFTGLWTDRRAGRRRSPGSEPLSYTRDFQSPSGDTLLKMLATVMKLMECKTYNVAYRGARGSGPDTAERLKARWGDEIIPGIRNEDKEKVYVSVYKAVSGTDEDQVMQKQHTFGPFKIYRRTIKDNGRTVRDRLGRALGSVVLDSNDIFGEGDTNNLQSNGKYFLHKGIQIAPSIKVAKLKSQYNQLT